MKAALVTQFGSPLVVSEVKDPEIGKEDVLVNVKTCGMCYSDIKVWKGLLARKPSLPHILGHEIAGIVAKTGANVEGFKEGDKVVVYIHDPCGKCKACKLGNENYCIHAGPVVGMGRNGGFAEYVSVHSKNLFQISNDLDFVTASLLTDAFITPYHAIVRKAQVRFNDTVMLVGIGGLALCAIQVLKLMGVRVIAVSRTPSKLEMASNMGADIVINSTRSNVEEEVRRLTDGYGADFVFDFVSTSDLLEQDIHCVKRGGRIIMVGYQTSPFQFQPSLMGFNQVALEATRYGTRQDLQDLIRLASERKIKSVVTHTYPLEEINDGLVALSKSETVGRVAVTI